MSDTPLFRDGKVILKTRTLPDGSVLMFKPFIIREEHLMKMTGAPGWDKERVDATFTKGVIGTLRYIQDNVQYDIRIETFREHAFERDIVGYGSQYHVHKQYYRSSGVVSPKRVSAGYKPEEKSIPELPSKLTFGEWVPCTRCRATGIEPDKKKERCTKCQGQGYEQWSTSSATS